jgi:hypothetical protein
MCCDASGALVCLVYLRLFPDAAGRKKQVFQNQF